MPPKNDASKGGEQEEKVSWLRKLACCFPQKSKKKDVTQGRKERAPAEESAKLTSTAAATTSRTKDAGVEAMPKAEEAAKFSSVGVEVRKPEDDYKYANKASGADEPAISDDETKALPAVPTTVVSSESEPSQREAKALAPALEAESAATKSTSMSAKQESSQTSSKAAKVTGAVGGTVAAAIGAVAAAFAAAKFVREHKRHGKHHVLWGQVSRVSWPPHLVGFEGRERNLRWVCTLSVQSQSFADHLLRTSFMLHCSP